MGFPGGSCGKESNWNAGNPNQILGSGRSPGEGIGHPLQYSWVSLVAQMVKNLPAMWETWVWSLGWEDSLEKGTSPHFSILAWRISIDREAWLQSMGSQRVRHKWATKHSTAQHPAYRVVIIRIKHMSDSLRPPWSVARLQSVHGVRLLCPWNFSGKETEAQRS